MTNIQPLPPFDTSEGIRREFRRLARAGTETFELPFFTESSRLLAEIFASAKKNDLSIRMRTRHGAMLGKGRLRRVLGRLYRVRGPELGARRPLEALIFEKTLDALPGYDELIADVSGAAEELASLSSDFYVRFEARLTLHHIDSAKLIELGALLIRFPFFQIDLIFGFPPVSGPQAEQIKAHLRRFCLDPVARHRSLRIQGLPFCFLPAPDFPLLYRVAVSTPGILGNMPQQAAALRAVESISHRFLPPCRACRRRRSCYALSNIESHPEYIQHLEPGQESTVVFADGSLTPQDRLGFKRQDMVFARPAEQGSLFMALSEGFRDILLLDGYFPNRYSPATSEVMLALKRGVNVIGGAGTGALRAIELDRYGMRGAGYIYHFLKRHRIVPYHAAAQTYHEGARPRTVPLVAIRYFLERAAEEGIIDRLDIDRFYAAADDIRFPRLSFRHFLRILGKVSRSDAAARLSRYLDERGAGTFDINRIDALEVLSTYRRIIRRDGPGYASKTLKEEKDRCLSLLRARFDHGSDCTLPERWRESLDPGATTRERPIAETIKLAEHFFVDLDVIIGDISRFGPTGHSQVNMIFVPFFFLGYSPSSASGYGQTIEDALVRGYMELLERIPMGSGNTRRVPRKRSRAPIFPARLLPLFRSVSPDKNKRSGLTDRRGRPRRAPLIGCTDVMTGRIYALSSDCIHYPSSCGMASGNTFLEAVVYGIYEAIEHDVAGAYETRFLLAKLNRINLDSGLIRDENVRALMRSVRETGERIAFFDCLNIYDLPMSLCSIYSPEHKSFFQGFNCRIDRQAAMIRSFHEAMSARYIYASGTRDDKQKPEDDGTPFGEDAFSRSLGPPLPFPAKEANHPPLTEVLDILLSRLRRNGIRHVFAIDLSPKSEFDLKCVKIVIPGLDFRSDEGGDSSPSLSDKCIRTEAIIRATTRRSAASCNYPGPPPTEPTPSPWGRASGIRPPRGGEFSVGGS